MPDQRTYPVVSLTGTMDCLRCLEGEGKLAKLTYENDDTQQLYLCERCLRNFEADDTVRRVAVASTA